MKPWALRSDRVFVGGAFAPRIILVRDGRIEAIESASTPVHDRPLRDFGAHVVMPGLVDTHVHLNQPGRTEWEGFETATRAAARGGITTLVDMPLNSIPPTTRVAAFEQKLDSARGRVFVDLGFWGGVVPGNAGDLVPLLERGVLGFKCFMIDSGVPEFQHSGEADIREALLVLKDTGAPLLAHAELEPPIALAALKLKGKDFRRYATFLASRPPEAEDQAVRLLAELAAATGARVHVVHQASAGSLGIFEAAKNDGHRLSGETCPHYLHFAAEQIPDGATQYKCVPPIRESSHRDALWSALLTGVLDCVVSDHSPCTPSLKQPELGDFGQAWGGISSVQLTLPVTWSGLRARGLGMERLPQWMSEHPARLAGLTQKGAIAVGKDADFVVWDPEAEVQICGADLSHRHAITPYEGERLLGKVFATYVRGRAVFEDGVLLGPPAGELLLGRRGSV